MRQSKVLTHGEMLELRRWNTPTVYNGWEQITNHDTAGDCFNLEETTDFMPHMGPMVGRAVTVLCEPSKSSHKNKNPGAWEQYRKYIAENEGPKIVVLQDLDKPRVIGSFWGEVNSNIHRVLGCSGTITDGAIRDLEEMNYAGFKALARRLCIGHAHVWPVAWGVPVKVFGVDVEPGLLIHADRHGFIVIPPEDEAALLDAVRFMDSNECNHMISAARENPGKSIPELLDNINESVNSFGKRAFDHFGRKRGTL